MFSSCGFNVFAGRSFLGLGTLLTGAKVCWDKIHFLLARRDQLSHLVMLLDNDVNKCGPH